MNSTPTRYAGAQPFSDDDFSRKVFFGREQASITLTDQILANRMVVVYAKSGLGKTSLLNAGVAWRLRDEGYLPLIVRVNDVQQGPLVSVLEGIRAEAERQQVEYVPGLQDSLWTFFKTAEFWRGDLLLTPVLILDQFEELFTLQSEEQRASFLTDLSYLVRGVRPPALAQTDGSLDVNPPAVRVVLSLREDYLGFLEEAADHIPQILDHRFRLAPLTLDAASEAMTGPAAIDDSALATKPFRYDPETVATIVNYLSQRRTQGVAQTTRYVEPFQLQLICQRVERIVAQRQPQSPANLIVTLADIGGEAALEETLRAFYVDAIRALPKRSERRAVRRLCQEYLINPEGRRLSLEENEIRSQLELTGDTLRQLVANRLLRTDSRSDSIYYELSHDALVEPVLATRRKRGLLVGWLGLVLGLSLFLVGSGFGGLELYDELRLVSLKYASNVFFPIFLLLMIIASAAFSWRLLRGGLRNLLRYRRRSLAEFAEPVRSPLSARDSLLGWFSVAAGWGFFLLAISLAGMLLFLVGGAYYTGGEKPDWLELWPPKSWKLVYKDGPGLDLIVYFLAYVVMLLFALEILRWGIRKLLSLPQPRGIQAQVDTLLATSPWKVWQIGAVELISGIIVLLAAGFVGGLLLLSVLCHFKGISFMLSYSLPTPWLFWDLPWPLDWQLNQLFRFFRLLLGYVDHAHKNCLEIHTHGWNFDEVLWLLLLGVTSFSAVRLLRRGLWKIRSFLGAKSI